MFPVREILLDSSQQRKQVFLDQAEGQPLHLQAAFGDHHDVQAVGHEGLVDADRLAHQPLDAVSLHRASDLAADRQTQSPSVVPLTGPDEDDEVPREVAAASRVAGLEVVTLAQPVFAGES